ncbi:MAG: hypothetical protein HGA61_03510 [Candidatus Moranbacteria bacterium]|nr:hypothetical protein [Candidatus Moranbacteria bacterium]
MVLKKIDNMRIRNIKICCLDEKRNFFSGFFFALFWRKIFSEKRNANEKQITEARKVHFVIFTFNAPRIKIKEFEIKILKPADKTNSSSFVKKPNLMFMNLTREYPGKKSTINSEK